MHAVPLHFAFGYFHLMLSGMENLIGIFFCLHRGTTLRKSNSFCITQLFFNHLPLMPKGSVDQINSSSLLSLNMQLRQIKTKTLQLILWNLKTGTLFDLLAFWILSLVKFGFRLEQIFATSQIQFISKVTHNNYLPFLPKLILNPCNTL